MYDHMHEHVMYRHHKEQNDGLEGLFPGTVCCQLRPAWHIPPALMSPTRIFAKIIKYSLPVCHLFIIIVSFPLGGSLRSLCQKVLSLIVISEWGVLSGKAFLSIPLYISSVSLDFFSLLCLVILQLIITPTLIFVFLCALRNGMCSSRYPVLPSPIYPAICGSSVVHSKVPHILGVLIKICLALGGGVSLWIVAQLSDLLRLGLWKTTAWWSIWRDPGPKCKLLLSHGSINNKLWT